jgi:Holliday junction resolvase - archaeal type
MSGKHSRDKGARNEREFVNLHKEMGVDAERIPLSGANKGSFSGDVRIVGLIGECKVRRNGFKQLYDWLDHDDADFLVLRSDRKEWLIVIRFSLWERILRWLGLGKPYEERGLMA